MCLLPLQIDMTPNKQVPKQDGPARPRILQGEEGKPRHLCYLNSETEKKEPPKSFKETFIFHLLKPRKKCQTDRGTKYKKQNFISANGSHARCCWGNIWFTHHLYKGRVIITSGLNMFKPMGGPTLHTLQRTRQRRRAKKMLAAWASR